MANEIQERFHASYSRALTLTRTESSHCANSAELYRYKDTDVEKYRYVATLDNRTSEICQELDGKEFPVKDAKPGTNYPPMHPSCRSTTIEALSPELMKKLKRRARDPETDKLMTVPGDMTYREWYGKYVGGEIAEAIEPKYPFVEAKTIEEAQDFAQQFCNNGFMAKNFKGVVDYKGISVENANKINKALANAYSKVDLEKISGIKAIAPGSALGKMAFKDGADAVFAYDPIQHGIYINKDVLKSEKTFAEYVKRSEEAWNTVMGNIDKLSGSQKELALLYKNAGRSLVDGDTVEGMFTHELGHHAQWTLLDAKTNNSVGDRMKDYAPKLSGYANASKSEYLAESFAAYVKGETNLIDPEYVRFLDSKAIDNGVKSDIIKETGMFRKKEKQDTKYHFIDKQRIDQLTIEAKKNGAKIIIDEPWFNKRMEEQSGSAVTYGDVIVFGKNVTVSDVLEETYHFKQNLENLNADKNWEIREVLNEIDAKKYLLSVVDKYNIPRNETELTKKQLKNYEKQLEELLKKEG